MADDPLYVSALLYEANELRHFTKFLTRGQQGVWPSGGLAVTQHVGGANGTVAVAEGHAVILGTEDGPNDSAGDSSYYQFIAAQSVDILGPHPANGSNPRKDIIGVRVQDQEYSGVTDSGGIAVITGTPAGSPVDPTLPDNFIAIARILVGTGVSTITTANITDIRSLVDRDDVIALQRARATIGGGSLPWTAPNSVASVIPLDSETFDYHTDFNTSTYTYTVPATDDYELGAKVLFGFNNAVKQRGILWAYVNGSALTRLCDNSWTGLLTGDECTVTGVDQVHLTAGQTITFVFEPIGSSGNGVQVTAATGWIRRLG